MDINIISFPGLGIGPFEINKVAFSVLGVTIAWYGILIALGTLGGVAYAFWRGIKYNKILPDDMIDVALYSIPAAIVGARVYFILFNLEDYKTFYSLINLRGGGLAVYGGIIFGFLTALLVCKIKKVSVLKVFDATAPAIMLGQIIGRWGNFTNAEAYGRATDLPWRMSIQNIYSTKVIEVHPTFLYESLWNLVGFAIINLLYKKRKFDGQIFLLYITWYGFGRMLIEGLRTDSLYIGEARVSQIVGVVCFIAGAAALVVCSRKNAIKRLQEGAYESVYNLQAVNEEAGNEDTDNRLDEGSAENTKNETGRSENNKEKNREE